MNTAELIRDIRAQGICLELLPDGALRVRGDRGTISRLADTIRQHKPEIVAALSANDGPALPADEETRIRAWLAAIGETDPDVITEVINGCRRDADVRAYFLWRAALPFERTGGRRNLWSL